MGLKIKIFGQPIVNSNDPKYMEKLFEHGFDAAYSVIMASWNGSYAVVVEDDNLIYAFTDPHGVEQLYYTTNKQTPEFSNVIKDLVDKADLDNQYISEVCKWGYNTDNRTPWNYIKRLLPGEVFIGDIYSKDVAFIKKFDGYFDEKSDIGDDAEELRNRLHKAVLTRVKMLPEGTKTIAMLLSGGLDSACVAYELLNLQKQGELKDIEIKFYTINNSEDAPFVKIFAEKFGIDVNVLSYDMAEIDLKQALYINETPVDLGSMVPNQKMFELIPETIIFTGDGPDEMLGGYNRMDQYDSQLSDTFEELPFYHFPRLNKAAIYYGKTLVCPYLDRSIVSLALQVPLAERTHKKVLKTAYTGLIPDAIISRKKMPLKNDMLRADPLGYRMMLIKEFKSIVTQPDNTEK